MDLNNRHLDFIKRLTAKYLNQPYLRMKGGITNHVYKKYISNTSVTPWLDWIASGKATYHARVNKNEWLTLKPDDIIIFYDKANKSSEKNTLAYYDISLNNLGRAVKTLVTKLKYYPDFGAAFKDLGSKLVPIDNATELQVKDLYWEYYSEDDIEKNGVVAVGIKVIDNNQ